MKISTGMKICLVFVCLGLSVIGFMLKLPARFSQIDKELHTAFYFVAAAFLNLLFAKRNLFKHAIIFALLLLFSVAIEYAQEYSNHFFHRRIHGRYDIEDIYANGTGLMLFSIVWMVIAGLSYAFKRGKSSMPATQVNLAQPIVTEPVIVAGETQTIPTYFVDSFTNKQFHGNPAAVCMPAEELPDSLMQQLAAEIGFSETAFLKQITPGQYHIRFFTPKQEIPLCGHATLASAKIIFDNTTVDQISFFNRENVELKIRKAEGKIVMQFPLYETEPIKVPQAVLQALGIDAAVETRFSINNKIILLEISEAPLLGKLAPDFSALLKSYTGINGVLVTARSADDKYDFHYRYFWPWAGTNEDPVTGGVQTFLTKYWADKLRKTRLKAFQSSTRTGEMTTELLENSVLIYGEAIVVFEGKFNI
ncbi:MAG: PhzF family phenazine biosynthesis protein [Ferruginibacter sp.]|nr:PhzF family phenazine biosynthesis protein [Ferruginibacter sp.]